LLHNVYIIKNVYCVLVVIVVGITYM